MAYESRTGAVLFARDLERVATFYTAVLGLHETNRDDDPEGNVIQFREDAG